MFMAVIVSFLVLILVFALIQIARLAMVIFAVIYVPTYLIVKSVRRSVWAQRLRLRIKAGVDQ
jgi:hypothetical protein